MKTGSGRCFEPPGFAAMHLAIAAFVHDARGDRDAAGRYLQLVRWLEREEERLDPVLSLWQARLLARRGEYAEARALLERPEVAQDRRGQDEILEAWCEVLSEEGAWDEAQTVVTRAAEHAVRAGEPPLGLYATRLEARAVARAEPERAAGLLRSVADGFVRLEAIWEAAVTQLDLARVLGAHGEEPEAQRLVGEAAVVFEHVGSAREQAAARDLMESSV